MTEYTPLEDLDTGKKSNWCRYFNRKVLQAKDADGINKTIIENITEKSIVLSDKAKTYIEYFKICRGAYYRAINKINYNNYIYKLNRRYFKKNLFDSLLIASTFNYG